MTTDAEPYEEVGDALSLTAQVLEDGIGDLKAQTEEAVRSEQFEQVTDGTERLPHLREFSEAVVGVQRRWSEAAGFSTVLMLLGVADAEFEASGSASAKRYFGRVERGARTPELAFREPILRVLVEASGSNPAGEVVDRVGDVMADQLNDVDREPLASDPRTVRWRSTAPWARNMLADQGLIDRSVRGAWTITTAGREWLERRR